MSLNKVELTNRTVEVTGLTKKDTIATIEALFGVMADALSNGEEIAIPHFGKFKVVVKAERGGVNPQNPKEHITIPAKKVVKFVTSSVLKESVANG